MTKILILSDDFPPYARGGAGLIASIDAFELAKSGHEVRVLTTVRETSVEGTSEESGVTIKRIHVPQYHTRWRAYQSLYNRALVAQVRKEIDEFKPSIVHAHNVHEFLSYAVFAVAKRSGAKVFLTAHDVMSIHYGKLDRARMISSLEQLHEYRFRYNPVRNLYIRNTLKDVDQIFAVSEALKEALLVNGLKNISVLYNCIDPDAWITSRDAMDAFITKQDLAGKKVILFGGRITGMKGGTIITDLLPKIIKQVPDALLLIAGIETEYVRTLQVHASETGVADRIRCTGWLSHNEMSAAYSAANVVVVPSMYLDPLPTVVLEAMACAKPVVGMKNGGIPEMVQEGVTGLLVDQSSPEELAPALCELLHDTERAVMYGEAGKDLLREKFSVENHMKKLLAWYTGENEPDA